MTTKAHPDLPEGKAICAQPKYLNMLLFVWICNVADVEEQKDWICNEAPLFPFRGKRRR